VGSVFDEHGLTHREIRLVGQYPKLVFCVQYRESAFAFVSRLLEHVGILYWFEHHPTRHVLVLADSNHAAPFTQPRQAKLSLRYDLGEIQELEHDYMFHTGNWALNDFDFEAPVSDLRVHVPTRLDVEPMKRFELYDYPGNYTKRDYGAGLARLRMEEEEARHHRISGASSCIGFDPGKRFTLTTDEPTNDEEPALYLLTEVRHSAVERDYFSTSGEPATYSNHFVAIRADTPFRPERRTPKPVVPGLQTATVVGPAGENIHTDEYGRVRLLFHWDRRGRRDEHASCWIRVSQHAAGSYWGALAIPHVGQEVVVAFVEGDPDRPLVVGRVHNGVNMPPLHLPRDREKTILRDHGDNKIIMHGKPGHERLSLVSPKNINFVAMRSPAKALSAQTIDNVGFDDFEDGASLLELKNVFDQLAIQQAPAGLPKTQQDGNPGGNVYTSPSYTVPGTKPPTGQTVAEGADLATNVDINSLSEHDINSLSVVNTNGWVGGNSNTWVKGDLNQEVVGKTDTVAHGDTTNTYHSMVTDNFDTLHEENTTLHNEFCGAHSEFTGIHTELTGYHGEINGIHEESTGIHISLKDLCVREYTFADIATFAMKIWNTNLDLDQATLKLILGG
jgi:type VI secretion system VgrG family protein